MFTVEALSAIADSNSSMYLYNTWAWSNLWGGLRDYIWISLGGSETCPGCIR